MTVQQFIDELQKIQDKSATVVFTDTHQTWFEKFAFEYTQGSGILEPRLYIESCDTYHEDGAYALAA